MSNALPIPEFLDENLKNLRNKQNVMLTKALFVEFENDRTEAPFTLQDHSRVWKGREVKSMRELYLEYSDPTEYHFAIGVFGSWVHWLKITESPELLPFVQRWREELEVKLKAEAIREIRAASKDSKGFAAAKWLADRGWETKRGRPTKEEKERAARIDGKVRSAIEDDAERLGVH